MIDFIKMVGLVIAVAFGVLWFATAVVGAVWAMWFIWCNLYISLREWITGEDLGWKRP